MPRERRGRFRPPLRHPRRAARPEAAVTLFHFQHNKYSYEHAGLSWPAAFTLPPGSTVTSARVAFARAGAGAALVSPVVYGHTLAYGSTPAGPAAPYLAAGFGPWRPGTLAQNQSASWDLPSTWIAALIAGTIKGLAVWSAGYPDFTTFGSNSAELTITYTVPA